MYKKKNIIEDTNRTRNYTYLLRNVTEFFTTPFKFLKKIGAHIYLLKNLFSNTIRLM